MSNQKNILILTSKTGGGHVSLAQALHDLLVRGGQAEDNNDDKAIYDTKASAITIVDPQPELFQLQYRLVSRYALWLWAAEFQFLDTPARALLAHRFFTRLMRHRLHTLLDHVQPDLIITTYPFLSYEVMRVMEQRSSIIPLVMLFSDANSVHASWLTERRANATFATTRETYEQALANGFAPERLHLVGWPVRAQFFHSDLSKHELRKATLTRLQLAPDRCTVFLQGGGEGAARVNSTLENVLTISAHSHDVQIILAAGTNHNLRKRYSNVPNVAILPYTQEIAPYMAAADMIMGKAGPNILFESVMLGKPFVATTFIPGQEQENLSFIQRHGLGWVAIRKADQRSLLTKLVHNTDQLDALSTTINTYRQWNITANQRIVPLIHILLDT
jgi:UDP-N-acetylglucosamine:LPS N-acetylglucosamine transferase